MSSESSAAVAKLSFGRDLWLMFVRCLLRLERMVSRSGCDAIVSNEYSLEDHRSFQMVSV